MGLMYYPNPGEILLCNYNSGFILPEMTKIRPVAVVSPRLRRRAELVGVVPLSTSEPHETEDHHCRIELANPLPPPFDSAVMWAKCDMLATVAKSRLDRFRGGRKGGSRTFLSGQLDPVQVKALRSAILCGLGMGSLTIHL